MTIFLLIIRLFFENRFLISVPVKAFSGTV